MPLHTQRLSHTPSDLAIAASLLHSGQLVAVPTETVYGLAGRADRAKTLLSIFEAKQRPTFDPLIGHIPQHWTWNDLLSNGWIESSPLEQEYRRLMSAFWPGPLTLLFPSGPCVHAAQDIMTSGSAWVALRMPSHPVFQALLSQLNLCIAAPSANRFGRVSPTDAQSVWDELHGRIDAVVDGGPCTFGVESTIIGPRYRDGQWSWAILRPGAIAQVEIERILERPLETIKGHEIVAPGMLKSHYATTTPLKLFAANESPAAGTVPVRLRTFGPLDHSIVEAEPQSRSLTETRDGSPAQLAEIAAASLFRSMRALDSLGVAWIAVEMPPAMWMSDTSTLWPAIVDRLKRASVS